MRPLDVGMYGNRFGSRRCIVAAAMAETDVAPCKSNAGGSVAWSGVDRRYHRRCRLGAIWLLVATMVGLLAVSQLAAQDYEFIEINPRFVLPEESDFESRRDYRDEYRKIKSQTSDARDNVQDALKAGSTNFSADGDLYLREYRIAQMTQPKELYISNLGRLRTEFLREFLGSRAAPQTRQPMIQKLLPMLEDIVKGNYHPAVRLNAVTLIGLLDDTEGDSSQPPRPSAAAYESLKRIWSNPDSPEAVKVGAMSGIRRFAELSRMGATGSVQGSDLKTELLSIANGQAAGQDKWSSDLSYWLQRRATQILGYIGEGDDVVSTLTSVIKSAPADGGRDNFWLRYDALQSLANLKFDQLNSEQVQPLIDDVLGFAAFALEREAATLEKSVQDLVYVNILWADTDLEQGGKRPRRPAGGMPGGGRGGGLPGGGGKAGSIGGLGSTGAGGGAAGFGGGDDGGGLPGGGARGGGLPPGGGRGGGAFGGGRPGLGDPMKKDKVELPVFELNDSRARIKAVLVTARTFLKEFRYDIGIVTAANQETAQRINEQLLPAIDELLKKTELGVIDYRELRGEEPEEVDTTSELTQVYKDGAAQLRKLITIPPEKDAGQPVAQGLGQ